MAFRDEKKVDFTRSESIDKVEDISSAREHAAQIAELSGIEATAASKAAWLISITVSLVDYYSVRSNRAAQRNSEMNSN